MLLCPFLLEETEGRHESSSDVDVDDRGVTWSWRARVRSCS